MTAIGLAIPAESVDDHFVVALVHALAEPLIQSGRSLMTQVVHDEEAERAVYRHWADVGGIDGVALLGVGAGDSRPGLLSSLGFAHAAVIDASVDAQLPAVVVDAHASVSVLRTFLESRAPRRAIYLTGTPGTDVTASRLAAVQAIEADSFFEVLRTEHSVEAALAAGGTALADGSATLIFDSDVHAAAALAAFQSEGLSIPDGVGIVSWTNSVLCRSTNPPITAIDRRGSEIGAMLGARILGALAGDDETRDTAPRPIVVAGETA